MPSPDGTAGPVRCFGNGPNQQLLADYHDTEWGVPVHDDVALFEALILEGAHAGLSWETVLKKREGYRAVFHGFDIDRVAAMSDDELAAALQNPGIVRHRQKVASARKNAQVARNIVTEAGSLDGYLWSFVGGAPIKGDWATPDQIPATSVEGDALSKDLKKRGMSFVGPTIIYAFMQGVGMVNDHARTCWRFGA